MSDLVVASNCCMTRIRAVYTAMLECFPEKPSWCRNEQVCHGGQKV